MESESVLQRWRRTMEASLLKPVFATTGISSSSAIASNHETPSPGRREQKHTKQYLPYVLTQFERILSNDIVDLEILRKLSWNGVPPKYRGDVWKMLLGYMPLKRDRREETIKRKRAEYLDSVPLYFSTSSDVDRTTTEGEIRRQILVDLPRTCPSTPLFHQQSVRCAMERILYIWAIRHPASGYVQGMNDILTPLWIVCSQGFVSDPTRTDFESLGSHILNAIEADLYWCFSKLMDNIQDHYTFAQPGLQRMVNRLETITHRIDADLHNYITQEGVQYMQFGFRWMNCLLIREMPLQSIIRLWDTYLSEDKNGFEGFHVYVCVVLLKTFKEQLMSMGFQEILMFLQELPTSMWSEGEVEPLLSQAYILSNLFENAPSHLTT